LLGEISAKLPKIRPLGINIIFLFCASSGVRDAGEMLWGETDFHTRKFSFQRNAMHTYPGCHTVRISVRY
jgi:hypothetical protein